MPEEEKSLVEEEVKPPIVEEEEEEESDEEKAEHESATRLYNALKDPKTAKQVIRSLAAEAGLLETKEEKKEAKSSILDILSDSLGEEYKFLAPKLGPAIEKILGEHTKNINTQFQEAQMREVERETNTAITEVSKQFKDFELFQPAIVKLMEKYTPGKDTTQREYLTDLYKLAKSQASEDSTTERRGKKVEQARNDVPGALHGKSVGGSDKINSKSERPLTLKQAIGQALDELSSGAEE